MQNAIFQLSKNDLREVFSEMLAEHEKQTKFENQNNDRLLDSAETEALLKVDKTTLWRWAKRGYLIPRKVGGLNRYRFSDINAIMEGK